MQRIEYIDTAKGICIILVVCFHCGLFQIELLDSILYCLRLPLYYFLSGLFFKTYDSLSLFLRKKVNNLIIPFSFFYITTSVILPNIFSSLLDYHINTVTGWPSLWAFVYPEKFPNIPIWFLWSLFLSNMVFYLICRASHIKYVRCLLSVMVCTVGYVSRICDINLPAFIDDTFFYFPFFLLGHVYNVRGMLHRQLSRRHIVSVTLSLIAVIYLLSLVLIGGDTVVSTLVVLPIGVLGVMAMLLISRLINRMSMVTYFGRYSIMILVTHDFLLLVLRTALSHLFTISEPLMGYLLLLVSLPCYYIIIPLMCRYLPYVTAQKNVFYSSKLL